MKFRYATSGILLAPSLIGENMLLQPDAPIRIWGRAAASQPGSVTLGK